MTETVPLDVLALGPHPDDVELSCGGLLAASAARGQRVGIADLTRGELSTNGTVEVRAGEAAAAAEILGAVVRENLGLPDGGLRSEHAEHIDAVVGVIRRWRPALLLAPHTAARHPDHAATGALARTAGFLAGVRKHRPDLGAPHRPGRVLWYPQRHEVRPDLVVDVTEVYGTKQAAIAAHASQLGGRPTLLNQPLGTEAFEVRDRYWGASIGVRYGEPYLSGGPVPVRDPVSHFLTHPESPVLWVG